MFYRADGFALQWNIVICGRDRAEMHGPLIMQKNEEGGI